MKRRGAQVLAVVGGLVVLVVTVHFYAVLDEEILWNVMLGMIGVLGVLAPLLIYRANPRKPGFSSLRTLCCGLDFEFFMNR